MNEDYAGVTETTESTQGPVYYTTFFEFLEQLAADRCIALPGDSDANKEWNAQTERFVSGVRKVGLEEAKASFFTGWSGKRQPCSINTNDSFNQIMFLAGYALSGEYTWLSSQRSVTYPAIHHYIYETIIHEDCLDHEQNLLLAHLRRSDEGQYLEEQGMNRIETNEKIQEEAYIHEILLPLFDELVSYDSH